MTTKYDRYDREYWHAAGMDDDLQLGPPIVGVILISIIGAFTGLGLVALVIREIVR